MTNKAKRRRRELAKELGVSRRTAHNIIAARRAASRATTDRAGATSAAADAPTSAVTTPPEAHDSELEDWGPPGDRASDYDDPPLQLSPDANQKWAARLQEDPKRRDE